MSNILTASLNVVTFKYVDGLALGYAVLYNLELEFIVIIMYIFYYSGFPVFKKPYFHTFLKICCGHY